MLKCINFPLIREWSSLVKDILYLIPLLSNELLYFEFKERETGRSGGVGEDGLELA